MFSSAEKSWPWISGAEKSASDAITINTDEDFIGPTGMSMDFSISGRSSPATARRGNSATALHPQFLMSDSRKRSFLAD